MCNNLNLNTMKEVIRVNWDGHKHEEEKPVEFTHVQLQDGWTQVGNGPGLYDSVIYIGRCNIDGDIFAVYNDGNILIFKGHLNSGKY